MKFYDMEWLSKKCGTENKYEITAKIAAEARRESEKSNQDKSDPMNERYISNVLSEIEQDKSPINIQNQGIDMEMANKIFNPSSSDDE